MLKPLSARTMSPRSNFFKKPDYIVKCLSVTLPLQAGEIKVMLPPQAEEIMVVTPAETNITACHSTKSEQKHHMSDHK